MKTIVTGASGYVGGMILRSLRLAGHETQAWSRRECPPPWRFFNLAEAPPADAFIGFDALVHAAHDFTARNSAEQEIRNVRPSLALLESARSAGIRRLVFISSLSSFDNTRSAYGRAKLAIEKKWLANGSTVIRPGLVWGDEAGGLMGELERVVTHLPLIPCLTGPRGLPQYLTHEQDLCAVLLDALRADPPATGRLLEAAHPDSVTLREILTRIVRRRSLRRLMLPVPWQLAMAALKTAEFIGLSPPFRSDNLTGLVHGVPSLQTDQSPPRGRFSAFF